MQQLNVLPINTSQNVETKDDANAFVSPSSKDDFSQHIDLHLAKNKDVNHNKNKAADKNVDTKLGNDSTESRNLKTDEHTQNSSGETHVLVDEANSASEAQEVAATGKKDEKKSSEDHKTIDDSELLMSFLTKADNTLVEGGSVDESLVEGTKLGKMSAEQQAKYEAQLLLKSSDLVADLSDVARAINPNFEAALADLTEQEKVANSLLSSSKISKTNTEVNQLNAKALIEENNVEGNSLEAENLADDNKENVNSKTQVEGNSLVNGSLVNENNGKLNQKTESNTADSDLLKNNKSILEQQLNADKLNEEGLGDSAVEDKKSVALAQNTTVQQRAKNDLEGKVSNQVGVDSEQSSEKFPQKEISQQNLMPENKNIDPADIKLVPKSTASVEVISGEQNPFEVESKLNDKITKSEANLALASSVSQNANTDNNKNLSTANLGQNTPTEPVVKQGSLVESEAQLSAKSVEQLIEQSKEFSVDENKGVRAKVLPKTNTDFSINSNFMDATSRATQATYDRVDQQVAEIFNPTGSSEVSQSQKTNTQLHQETISIFRRDFADAVKDKVMLVISQKLQQFDITLDPPELGNMQVRVNLQGEQASVNFVVQNQQAKDALEQNMHKLRDLLAEQGVDVGDANVEQQSQQSDQEENTGNSQHNSVTNTADASDVIEHDLSARMLNSSSTGVDYYA